jgi:hypothetical protein
VDQDGLACPEASVIDQRLPGGQPGDGQSGGHDVVDVRRKRSEVAGFHCAVLGQGAVAGPVGQPEHPLADGEAGSSVSQLSDDTRQLMAGHARRPVAPGAVGPCCGPVQLAGRETRGMDPHDDIIPGGVRVGQVRQGQPADTGIAVLNGDGFHEIRF